ncbi:MULTISPECIES: ABC transporter substrate-binding protein [Alphaproteobacteria]|uniref:ABC transporter substrate-binding protein n=1 Tax=Alphaproteobacteria TaxID=28211 RepID=UPI003A9303CC
MELTEIWKYASRPACAFIATIAMSTVTVAEDLTIAFSAPPTTIDPHAVSSAPSNSAGRHIFDSLINRGGNAENLPQLAISWKPLDATHWEFRLREGVTFHDGTTFDSEDVVASLNRVASMPGKAFDPYTRTIKNVEATGPYTVVVETHAADPLILNSLSRLRIVSAEFANSGSDAFDQGKAVIGTGPFKFVSYTPGDEIVLERNDDYFAGPASWENLSIRIIPDSGARLAALLSGDVDLIEALPAEGQVRVAESPDHEVMRGQSTRLIYLAPDLFNDVSPQITDKDGNALDQNPLRDIRVRQALRKSINRVAIVERIMSGNATVAHQWVAEGFLGNSANVEKVEYDPEGAKELLAAAGYPDGFRMQINGPAGRYENDSQVLQAVGQMFSSIGVDTTVIVQPWSVFGPAYPDHVFSVYLASWGINTGEVTNPTLAIAVSTDADAGTGRYNGAGINDPRIDALMEQALQELDGDKREAQMQEISELIFNNSYLMPLHYESVALGARKGLSYEPRSDKYTLAYDIKPAE